MGLKDQRGDLQIHHPIQGQFLYKYQCQLMNNVMMMTLADISCMVLITYQHRPGVGAEHHLQTLPVLRGKVHILPQR